MPVRTSLEDLLPPATVITRTARIELDHVKYLPKPDG